MTQRRAWPCWRLAPVVLGYIQPMGVLVRSLLVWLLVLAVPAKGLAAASMALCGLQQEPAVPMAVAAPAWAASHAGQVVQPMAHATAHAADRHMGDAADHPEGQASDHRPDRLSGHPADHPSDHPTEHHAAHGAAPAEHMDHDHAGPAHPCAGAALDGSHKCSACAACGVALALPSTVLTVPAVEPMATVFAAVVPSVRPVARGGPDRPPRPACA